MKCLHLILLSTFLLYVTAQNETTDVPCSHCASLYHEKLNCPADLPPGCMGDLVTCPCLFDCRNITMRCETKGNWAPLPSNGPYCLPANSYNDAVIGDHRRVSYSHTRGQYTFECEAGFTLQGFPIVTCNNNILSDPFPECVKGGNTVNETTTLVPTTETTVITLSQNKGPETMIAISTTVEHLTITIPTTLLTITQKMSEEIATITPQVPEQITEITTKIYKNEIKGDPIETTTIKSEIITENISTTALPYKETEESSSLGLFIIIAVLSTFVISGTIIGVYFFIQRRKRKIAKQKALNRMSKIVGPNMYEAHDPNTSYLKYLSMVDANFTLNTEDKQSETDFNEQRNEVDIEDDMSDLPPPRMSML